MPQTPDARSVPLSERYPSDALLAERYGFPIIEGPAQHLIAALHSVINWILAHPDAPVPQMIDLVYSDKFDPARTVQSPADLIDVAAYVDGVISTGSGTHQWAKAAIPTGNGVRATYVAHAGEVRPAR
jgi:hypothetical protein